MNDRTFILKTFSYGNNAYMVVDIGDKTNGRLYFPDTHIVNITKNESIFIANTMKFGVQNVNIVNDEVHIYGNCWGQSTQWERYKIISGEYVGYINDDGSYENPE